MKNRGFSLVELMVVLIIISLSAALAVPSLSRLSRSMELKAVAKKVSAILRYGRSEAVNKGVVHQIHFDQKLREVRVQSLEEERKDRIKRYPFPEDVEMREIEFSPPQYTSDLPTIEFYPNGSSNGGSLFLDGGVRRGYKISIHFITGMVKVEASGI